MEFINISEKELEILETIYQSEQHIKQRDLAEIARLSLGMTNSILKRLVQKGLLKIRRINNRNITYIVSPKGVDEITRRSYRYLKRTIKNVVLYKETVTQFIRKLKNLGFQRLMLIGKSDLDFIIEHCCYVQGLQYIKSEAHENDHTFFLYSESYIPDTEIEKPNVAFLQRILMISRS